MSALSVGKGSAERMLNELRELNLNFLMLAQRMLNDNKVTAKAQLGLPDGVADTLMDMSTTDLMRLASTSLSLCTLRFDHEKLWALANDQSTDPRLTALHASILGFRHPVEHKLAG
ncbi:flagellar transcriptional regulator FlhD [Limnobacter humi]|uniref:Flagellar transcriptional regulator FlhD n=1 Tax=Limnobacter humi TaxID=1778671 RepID=A0ABT1WJC6_9BURK|nr:flagellar transcriptional regulator FlhD [Limnobacter humi]MCQ8897524.1 flagellar transcriptional regulator FlhD [Limnobacter humi]